MPLKPGINNIRSNVDKLMKPVVSPARKKALMTMMKERGMTMEQAQFHQAKRIAEHMARR